MSNCIVCGLPREVCKATVDVKEKPCLASTQTQMATATGET
jgi:hypothetical protein